MSEPVGTQSQYVFIGTYSSSVHEGIHVLSFDESQGELTRICGVAGIENPSFLTVDSRRNRLFAVSETHNGAVVSFSFDPFSGRLEEINRQPAKGDDPCFLSLDETGAWLLAANYTSGSICLFPIEESGAIGRMADQIEHTGRGINIDRQDRAHPHSIVNLPNSPFWLVPDLGTDRIYVYRLDREHGRLELHAKVETEAGCGPRHLSFHPNRPYFYVIQELNSTIAAYEYDQTTGALFHRKTVGTLPSGFTGNNTCAEIRIAPDGRYLYGSNRGHDSIAAYRILKTGEPETLGFTSTNGKTPRNFAVDPAGSWLLAANQDSDSIVVLRLKDDGTPVPNGQTMNISKPVYIKMLPMPLPIRKL